LTVAGNSWFKDLDTYLKVIKEIMIRKLTINVKFVLVGFNSWGNSYNSNLFGEMKKNGFLDIVENIPHDRMPEIYNLHDIYLCTSIAEGMSVSILEALATGIPVVTTDCGGVREIISNVNGIICDVGDYRALASALIKTIGNLDNYDRNSVRQGILKYDYQNWANQLIKFINEN